ncbi:MAG: hypothetical protein IIA45_02620 [Bacteroidetes bacterium]|nr:hypothetical protein [Bacteroidota bacterium]
MVYKYLIRYGGEIGTKNRPTRWNFIRKLGKNVESAIKVVLGPEIAASTTINVNWDNITTHGPVELDAILTNIPGIKSFSLVHELQFEGFEKLIETAFELFKDEIGGRDFAVRCKRIGKHNFSKKDVEEALGEKLLHLGKVNLSKPEITCFVEIRNNDVHLYSKKIPGMDGFPIGTQGKTLTMLSGGIDSPVAAWTIYRMGIEQVFVYFDLGGEDQLECIKNTYQILQKKWAAGSKSKLYIINFLPIIENIMTAKKSYQNLLLKYFFYKTAEKLGAYLKVDSLVTGESIGQVSTQTLKNLTALDQVISTMIVRPLAIHTKEEITKISEDIGTYDLSYKGKEYCALVAKNVTTGSSYENLMREAEHLDLSLIDAALDQKLIIKTGEDELLNTDSLPPVIPEDSEVIDLRTTKELKDFDLVNARHVPFQEAWADYVHWDKSNKYFLVCAEGSSSAILANYMKKDGYQVEHLKGGIKKLKAVQKTSP